MSSFSRKQKDVEHWLFRTVCKVTVGDVTKNFSRVLALDHNTTIAEAFGITEELLIQSVAVTGPPELFRGLGGGDGVDLVAGGKQYIGIVSVLDMLAYSLKHEDFLTHVLSDVIGSTDESQTFWCEDTDQPLYFALEQFVKGVHHALVQDSNDEEGTLPLKFLAQTDILRFLTSDPTALPHLKMLLEQPVGAVSTPCAAVSVSLATPLREAIALLREHSSLPVANEAGVVVSNLSASDFKGKRSLPLLTSPGATVHDLLCHQVHAVDQQPKLRSPAALSSSCSLHEAASFMLLHHMHRVWVVPATATDSDSLDSSSVSSNVLLEGLKVLTITDILRAVYDSESSLR